MLQAGKISVFWFLSILSRLFFSGVTEVLLFIMPTSMSHGELRSWKSAGEGLHSRRRESRNGSKTVVFHLVIEAY